MVPQQKQLAILLACCSLALPSVTADEKGNSLFGTIFGSLTLSSKCQTTGVACATTDDCPLGQVCLSNADSSTALACASERAAQATCGRANITYVPGNAVVFENGLVLSQGLTSRLIAQSGQPVQYANGRFSEEPFHNLPDGAAVFSKNSKARQFKYVSNSEDDTNGGVGSITFDTNGKVISYERLLSGSKRNCGGGKTFWNTWLSCEEVQGGRIWEVDPFARNGTVAARTTVMGAAYPSWYESAAYDNRNVNRPVLYATIDNEYGPLLRYTPPVAASVAARRSKNYTQLLHTKTGGGAQHHKYLVVEPSNMTYTWISDPKVAEKNAFTYYKNCEGLDIRNGLLYMTCKVNKQLYILDLDKRTYTVSSTVSGAFDGQPDQVARILNANKDEMLYFCEDTEQKTGVHARDSNGKYFSILQAEGSGGNDGETSGIAFSPGNHFMYVSFQQVGKIFEIRRTDGRPFSGQRLDIKYHDDPSNVNPFV